MKIVDAIKSFLFGEPDADSTAQFHPEEDEYTQENSLYVPPTLDEPCHQKSAFIESMSEKESHIDDNTVISENESSDVSEYTIEEMQSDLLAPHMDKLEDTDILSKDGLQPHKVNWKEEAMSTLITKDATGVDVKKEHEIASHVEIGEQASGNELHSIFQSFVELIDELDALHNRIDDDNSKEIINYCEERIIETIIARGGKPIEKEDTYNVERHIPVPFQMVDEGTPISELVRKGIEDSEGVLLKALVKI